MTRSLSADIAVPAQCYLAEGPVWDPVARRLRWVDINPGHVHAVDPVTGAHTRFAAAGADGPAVPRADAVPVGAIGLTISGGLVLALVVRSRRTRQRRELPAHARRGVPRR
jgi:sugar lactone lactonase YvrE